MNPYPHAVDCHCHIYPEKIAARAVAGIGSFYGITMHQDGTEATLRRCAQEAGITHAMIFSVATKPAQTRSINDFIAETVKKDPTLFSGLGTLHPASDDIEGDFQHVLDLGLLGIKLHPDTQGFKIDDYRCLKIYELCEKHGLPVLLHTGDARYDYSNPNRLKPILEIFTNLTVIGAHFGGYSVWDDAVRELAGNPNLYVDCSSTFFMQPKECVKAYIAAYGADHVLFGTDYPMWNPAEEMQFLLSLGLSEEEYENILWKNAEKLFHLEHY